MITTEITQRGIATLTFDRPNESNRMGDAMLDAVAGALNRFAANSFVRVLVIRANGRHFCAGADIAGHRLASRTGARPRFPHTLLSIELFPKPVVCLVQGAAVGGGAAIAACADIVLAERQAFFAIPEVRIGMPAGALVPLLARAIGYRQLRRYALTGERIDAETARRIGLAHEIYDAGQEEAALAPILDALLLGAPGALAATKRITSEHASQDLDPNQVLAMDDNIEAVLTSPEMQEGMDAFLNKRKPRWYREG